MQALICGASFGALASNARAPPDGRPPADRPARRRLPWARRDAGALVGVLLNKTLPSLVILLAMALVLSATAVQTCRKGAAQLAADRRLERLGGGGDAAVEPEEVEKGLLKPKTPASGAAAAACRHAAAGSVARRRRARRARAARRRRRRCCPLPPPLVAPRRPATRRRAVKCGSARRRRYDAESRARTARRRMARIGRAAPRRGGRGMRSPLGLPACGPAYWALSAVGFSFCSSCRPRRGAASSRARARAAPPAAAPADGDVDWGARSRRRACA